MNVAQVLVERIGTDYRSDGLPLPSLPDVALRVRQAVDDPRKGIDEVARLVQLDPGLTARVVQVANSARYAGAQQVSTCHLAVSRLGLKQVRDLVTALALRSTFHTKSPTLAGLMRQVWQRSVHVAAIARVLGSIGPDLEPERAMLAGLVGDIGVLPVLAYAETMPELAADPALLERVAARLKPRLGAMVLEKWGFDRDIVRVPLQSEQWARDPDAMPDYADVVMLAKVFSTFGGDRRYGDVPPLTELPAFNKFPLGALGPQGGVELLEEAREEINRVKQMLSG